ncbi:MAG: glycosyltransferase family 2 protein [Bacilli bacterium]|nr:glycosyltransferase family 2 protein [Bacilli bacterium]MDD4795893.1 glycosyltransferase family 2 protein [Bacilli bacterium]
MLVSVIVPVYNTKEYVPKCLDSILKQTYDKLEIIVVNDCSLDGVEEILEEYKAKDKRIKVINFKNNHGVSHARNSAVKKSRGKFITFVDSDDYISKNMINKMVKKQQTSNCDIVKCDKFTIVEGENKYQFGTLKTDNNHESYIISIPMIQAQLISRDIVEKIPFPDGNIFYEDLAIVPAFALEANKIEFIEDSSYHYVQRKGSTMHQNEFNSKLLNIFPALDKLQRQFKIKGKQDFYYKELEYTYIQHLLYRASLRFLKYDNYADILPSINKVISESYPKWYNNLYYKNQMDIKKKMFCRLISLRLYKVAKRLMRRRIYE